MMSMLRITPRQREYVLERFAADADPKTAHAHTWSRRSYAPMYVHDPELDSYRSALEQRFPGYVIAFDVVPRRGARGRVARRPRVPWSLSRARPLRAVRNHHFLTAHVNLTPDGGALLTYPREGLSWIYFWVVSTFGIFSVAHTLLVALTRPFSRVGARATTRRRESGRLRQHTPARRDLRRARLLRRATRETRRHPHARVRRGRDRALVGMRRLRDASRRPQTSVDVSDVPWVDAFRSAGAE